MSEDNKDLENGAIDSNISTQLRNKDIELLKILSALYSDKPVLLHNDEPKLINTFRIVKDIDPDCTTISLRDVSPESLNGIFTIDPSTGNFQKIKPEWFIDFEEKCKKEPDKFHIIFFDEITNTPPSIQAMVFNIILAKEVNGEWTLPENARIVLGRNEISHSLAADQLGDSIHNRCVNVYLSDLADFKIEGDRLELAKNNLNPLIYEFILHNDGNTPDVSLRKWETASRMFDKTKNPDLLREIIGDEMTNKFVKFYNLSLMSQDDNNNLESINEEKNII